MQYVKSRRWLFQTLDRLSGQVTLRRATVMVHRERERDDRWPLEGQRVVGRTGVVRRSKDLTVGADFETLTNFFDEFREKDDVASSPCAAVSPWCTSESEGFADHSRHKSFLFVT